MTDEEIIKLIIDTFDAIVDYGTQTKDKSIQDQLKKLMQEIGKDNKRVLCGTWSTKRPGVTRSIEESNAKRWLKKNCKHIINKSVLSVLIGMYVIQFIRERTNKGADESLFKITFKQNTSENRIANDLNEFIEILNKLPNLQMKSAFNDAFKDILDKYNKLSPKEFQEDVDRLVQIATGEQDLDLSSEFGKQGRISCYIKQWYLSLNNLNLGQDNTQKNL